MPHNTIIPLPFIDLSAQQQRILPSITARLQRVLEHGQYIMGPENRELEDRLAAYVGCRHAIACSSGTDALLMPLMAWGIGPGDAIFTTPFTFVATAEVIALCGATPVFVDIDPQTFNLDPVHLERAIEAVLTGDEKKYPLPRQAVENRLTPKAIIPVDLFGAPADYQQIMAVAARYGLKVLEDAAQSFGGSIGGKRAGSFGHAAATSFFPAKPLGGYGDGGAIFTDDDGLAEVLCSIRVHGQGNDRYENIRVGMNGRLDTMQAAVLLAKLEIFDQELLSRRNIADSYTAAFAEIPGLTPPHIDNGVSSAWAQYSLLHDQRNAIRASLESQGIPTAVYYPKPLHHQGAFASLGYANGSMPVSETTAQKIFSLPMHPYLSDEDRNRVIDTVKTACML